MFFFPCRGHATRYQNIWKKADADVTFLLIDFHDFSKRFSFAFDECWWKWVLTRRNAGLGLRCCHRACAWFISSFLILRRKTRWYVFASASVYRQSTSSFPLLKLLPRAHVPLGQHREKSLPVLTIKNVGSGYEIAPLLSSFSTDPISEKIGFKIRNQWNNQTSVIN